MPEIQTNTEEFYGAVAYVHPEDDLEMPIRWTSQYGVRLPNGSIVCVNNGTLAIQGPNQVPDAINYDEYIGDVLDGVNEPSDIQLVEFNPTSMRYEAL